MRTQGRERERSPREEGGGEARARGKRPGGRWRWEGQDRFSCLHMPHGAVPYAQLVSKAYAKSFAHKNQGGLSKKSMVQKASMGVIDVIT